ncbi:MAG: hypothetical protein R3A52_14335 [Polyangiales bacterium]
MTAWLHHAAGDRWPSVLARLQGDKPAKHAVSDVPDDSVAVGLTPARLLSALADAPLIPTAGARWTTPRDAATASGKLYLWRGKEPLSDDLSPWLGEVLWLPPERPRLEAFLSPLDLTDSADAVARRRPRATAT